MVIYDNEFEQRKIKFKPRIKLNHNIYIYQFSDDLLFVVFFVVFCCFVRCEDNIFLCLMYMNTRQNNVGLLAKIFQPSLF